MMRTNFIARLHRRLLRSIATVAWVVWVDGSVIAQPPPAEAARTAAPDVSLDALAWLEGCWRGSVNQREFREHWLPLRGGMMVGASQTVVQDKTQDFEYLRIEARPDGIYYVAAPSGKNEAAFRLDKLATDEHGPEFTFVNAASQFPQRIVYRRGAEGWLYAAVEGRVNGEERKVIYPMRRIGCESGEVLRK